MHCWNRIGVTHVGTWEAIHTPEAGVDMEKVEHERVDAMTRVGVSSKHDGLELGRHGEVVDVACVAEVEGAVDGAAVEDKDADGEVVGAVDAPDVEGMDGYQAAGALEAAETASKLVQASKVITWKERWGRAWGHALMPWATSVGYLSAVVVGVKLWPAEELRELRFAPYLPPVAVNL